MLNIKKQNAFIKTSILSGIALALLISGLVYIVNSNQTNQIANDDIVATENLASKNSINELFKLTTSTDTTQVSSINPSFQINEIGTYHISLDDNASYDLTVAKYTDNQGQEKKAIIYLPEEKSSDEDSIEEKAKKAVTTDKPAQFRYEKWLKTSEAIKKYTDEQSLFVSYWDNAQRIHLFTGRETWIKGPAKNAYQSKEEQALWESVAGGFDTNETLSKYSQFLLQDMDTAISELQKVLPIDKNTYILVSSDDLAHVQEIATLAGKGLPLETKLFPAAADLHNSISKVKEWAKEGNGTGSYLVQPMSEKFNRVWRITDKSFEDSLLVRLLPFTSSLDKSFDKTKLVYQSDWGAYLSIYQLIN
ncbi:MAG: hypothetical protein HND53_02350 [Proteobacteria bacterium]|nr:hypothetical protein [Pseudomonadota bacterium]NOG59312.1 hypothetical protein [Pseudomonadota bacterium]